MVFTNVLLVSAQPPDQAAVRSALDAIRGRPYRLELAGTMTEALAEVRAGRVDAIILDLVLPDSQGVTTFLRLQPKASNLPVVVFVTERDEDLGRQAVARGALDLLVKENLTPQLLDTVLRYATERTHTLKALKASEQRYRELFQNVAAGVFQTTVDGKFMAANPALVHMLGYESEDELLAVDVARDVYADPEHRETWVRAMAEHGEVRNAELVLRRRDGSTLVVLENSRAVRGPDGTVLFFEGTLTDITAAHAHSQQLSHEASHDPLTGLKNRREFEARLQRMLDLAHAHGSAHAVCFIDLDRFKVVNDTCGHVAGDELLRQLGQLLQSKVRSTDVVARLGGDEFAVLMQDCRPEVAEEVADTVLDAVAKFQFTWGSKTFNLGASIGVVAVTSYFKRLSQVMSAADTACYAAKDAGRNRVVVYQQDATTTGLSRDADWGLRARRALVENRLFLEAQPIVSLTDDGAGATYYEVLVRMRDDTGRVVPPGAFLPTVERYNLSVTYDRWVINNALQWIQKNVASLDLGTRFFINLSRDTVMDRETAAYVRQAFARTGVDPGRLGFEVAESVAIASVGQVNQLFAELRRLGCRVSLDDFGSGVSSFAYLKALGADIVKIDGMVVGSISQDRVDYAMVRSINEICHVMGKRVIAKAVESDAVLDKLREIGVDFAQGFAVGQPRPIEELTRVQIADLLTG